VSSFHHHWRKARFYHTPRMYTTIALYDVRKFPAAQWLNGPFSQPRRNVTLPQKTTSHVGIPYKYDATAKTSTMTKARLSSLQLFAFQTG